MSSVYFKKRNYIIINELEKNYSCLYMSIVSVYDENARVWSYVKSFFDKHVIINVIK
jgi:hypothetical protein